MGFIHMHVWSSKYSFQPATTNIQRVRTRRRLHINVMKNSAQREEAKRCRSPVICLINKCKNVYIIWVSCFNQRFGVNYCWNDLRTAALMTLCSNTMYSCIAVYKYIERVKLYLCFWLLWINILWFDGSVEIQRFMPLV